MKIKNTLAAVVSALTVLSSSVLADCYSESMMRNTIIPTLSGQNYEIHDFVETELLSEGEKENFWITPDCGDLVALWAVGDIDSNDVDIRVYDNDGELVASDVKKDDNPCVGFAADGRCYKVVITMYDTDRPAIVELAYATK